MTAQSGLGFSGIVAIQIPDEGATGEVLTKLTPDDYDYDWLAAGGGAAPANAEYVVMSLDAVLTDERVLTAGADIDIVDGGAGGAVTISVTALAFGDVFKVGTPVDNEIGVWTGDGTLEGDPDLIWDGVELNIGGNVHIRGDTLVLQDGSAGPFSIFHDANDELILYSGGNSSITGANIQMLGGARPSLSNHMFFRANTAIWQSWNETSGLWTIFTGIGAKTEALNIDASQDATFASEVLAIGDIESPRMVTRAAIPTFAMEDSDNPSLDKQNWDFTILGDAFVARIWNNNYVNFRNWWVVDRQFTLSFIEIKRIRLFAGAAVLAIDINDDGDVSLPQDVLVGGTFTSQGIDDNATAEKIQIADNLIDLLTDVDILGTVNVAGFVQYATLTDAALDDIANAVNTDAGKIQGAMVYNSTQDVPVYAVGAADGDVWVDGAGTTVNTPV